MRAENNVFAGCVFGAVNFGEWPDRIVDPGKGAYLDGNIFWNNGSAFENRFARPGMTVMPFGFRCLEATLASTLVRLTPTDTVSPSSRSISFCMVAAIVS